MAELPSGFAAIILVGGKARRFAGCAKSELVVGGATILERMLSACEGAAARVVVGSRPSASAALPGGVTGLVEDPPGSGPAHAVAAGLRVVPEDCTRVAILGGDLPFLTLEALQLLIANSEPENTGAVYGDDAGRKQWLCGLWPASRVRQNAAAVSPGAPAKSLFAGIEVNVVPWNAASPPPWFDCDTPADLDQARTWATDT
ncbi:molybdenum cofactor guanylyltransferase [Glycomyces sp. NPDC046736]|uniref:molybdenum cofactor guanylyltransferase n=1 Tax=Glycomyces sp. NPDC046736 TaxID=3155615 RepID=UPI0033E63059